MSNSICRRGFFRSFKNAVTSTLGAGTIAAVQAPQASAQSPGRLPFSPPSTPLLGGPFVNPEKVLLWENTRKEIRESLAKGRLKAAIIPTGSIEQHNEHLALVADVANSTFIAQQVALRLYPQVIVAPPSPCGYAFYHMARKGTITLRKSTFQANDGSITQKTPQYPTPIDPNPLRPISPAPPQNPCKTLGNTRCGCQ